jgi:hypothetical protein
MFVVDLSNPSSCTIALGFTQPLIEMRIMNFPGGGVKERPTREAESLNAIRKPTV